MVPTRLVVELNEALVDQSAEVVLVAVLGALRVETAPGCYVEVWRPMERRLLTALAAHRGAAVGVDVLMVRTLG